MEELINLVESFDLENFRYFYHITEKGMGEKILNNGLFMEDKNLYSTTIEVPLEMISNPINFCRGEYSGRLSKREEMVIIECEKDYIDYLVNKSNKSVWSLNQNMEYVVPSNRILCYIDLKNMNVTYNFDKQLDDNQRRL